MIGVSAAANPQEPHDLTPVGSMTSARNGLSFLVSSVPELNEET
jgi:hypothetical protein